MNLVQRDDIDESRPFLPKCVNVETIYLQVNIRKTRAQTSVQLLCGESASAITFD